MKAILDIVAGEISSKNPRKFYTEVNYEAVIDENSNEVYDEMSKSIVPYDVDQQYVKDLNTFLNELEPIEGRLIDYDEQPENDKMESEVLTNSETVQESQVQDTENPETPAETVSTAEDTTEFPVEEKKKEDCKSLKAQRDEVLISMYSEKIRKLQKEIDDQYEMFLRNPCSYTHFKDEWKKFYLEKSFELHTQGQNSYVLAWMVYWSQRIKEIKDNDMNQHQSKLKRKLNMPEGFGPFSDISEDEVEYEVPVKRVKSQTEVEDASRYVSPEDFRPLKPAESFSELDRMMVAYHVASQNFKNQVQFSAEELLKIMKMYVVDKDSVKEKNPKEVDFTNDMMI